MLLNPNTTNQIKIQDPDGDEVWFDVFTQGVVVTTKGVVRNWGPVGNWGPVIWLDHSDRKAVVRHLAPELLALLDSWKTNADVRDEDREGDFDPYSEAVAETLRGCIEDVRKQILGEA